MLLLAAQRVPGGRAVGADICRTADQSGNSQAAAERNAQLEGVADFHAGWFGSPVNATSLISARQPAQS